MSTVRALIASSFAQRAWGLLTRSRLHARAGVWFDRCSTVHSMGMRMPIDLVFLDAGFRIVELRTDWGATQIARCRAATSVLEVASGALARLQWRVGDQLCFSEPKSIPRHSATWRSITSTENGMQRNTHVGRSVIKILWLGCVLTGLASFRMEAHAQAPLLCSWGERTSQASVTPPDGKVIQRLLLQSELAYRENRDTDAVDLLYQILAQDPMLERAWFRLGNLMQRTGRLDAALAAYARAAYVDPTDEEPHRADRATRAKAALNVAMLSMQRARDALARIDTAGLDDTTRPIHAGLMERVGDLATVENTVRSKLTPRRREVMNPTPTVRYVR